MNLLKVIKSKFQIAKTVPFDNSTNSFSSEESQSAIEEAAALGGTFGRVPLLMLHNGTLSNNDEVGRNELMADKKYILPIDFVLTHLTWNNVRTSVSFDLEFYRYNNAGALYPGQPFWTYSVSNMQYDYVDNIAYTFVAGDYFKVIYKDQGTNARDFEGEIWGTRT